MVSSHDVPVRGGNRRIIMRAYAAFAIMLLFGICLVSVSFGTAPSDFVMLTVFP